jgi:hypothetical protein
MPIAGRPRIGLVILVLLLDLGLATAGAVMLQKGLAKAEPAEGAGSASHTTTAPASAPTGAAAAPAPVAPPLGASLAAITQQKPEPAPEPKEAAKEAAKDTRAPAKKAVKPAPGSGSATAAASGSGSVAAPQDPYEVKNALGSEIELAAARSRPDFDKCYADATQDLAIHGRVDIGFTVLPDGRVANVRPIQNTTNSPVLASCLITAIGRWAFAQRPAAPSEFVRPFLFP